MDPSGAIKLIARLPFGKLQSESAGMIGRRGQTVRLYTGILQRQSIEVTEPKTELGKGGEVSGRRRGNRPSSHPLTLTLMPAAAIT